MRPATQRASTAPVRFPSCHIGPGHLIRSRTTCLTPMLVMRVKEHQGWPFGAQAPGPDDARPRRRTRAGGCFAKPIFNDGVLPISGATSGLDSVLGC
jgi:hypothetical protein